MSFESVLDFFHQHYLAFRLIACFLLGFWWCVSGSLLQWTTQNPLACPVTLGVTAFPVALWLMVYLIGFDPESASALVWIVLVILLLHLHLYSHFSLISKYKFLQKENVIMFGVALNLSLAALYSFFYFYFSAQGRVMPSALWFGLLKNMDYAKFFLLFGSSAIFLVFLRPIITDLSLLSLGKSFARNFCNVELIEKKLLIVMSALMCVIIFTGGVFAFWGLLLPHLVRSISYFRGSLTREVYGGGIFAGFLMTFADFLCFQYPIAGSELPVGLLSSVLGPIFLISLLIKDSSKNS